jgi:hypothetical protein
MGEAGERASPTTCGPGLQPAATGCEDIDECTMDKGNCEQLCVNERGSYHCECNEGGYLEPDGRGCSRWHEATVLDDSGAVKVGSPQVGMAADGGATAVWLRQDNAADSLLHVWSSQYRANTWSPPEQLSATEQVPATRPLLTTDRRGRAVLVWTHEQGDRDIFARHFDGETWGAAQLLGTLSSTQGRALQTSLSGNANGEAMLSWGLYSEVVYIETARFTEGTWRDTRQVLSGSSASLTGVDNPQIAVAGNGEGFSVWSQAEGPSYGLWAEHYTPASGWTSVPQIVSRADTGSGSIVALAGRPRGSGAFTAWRQSVGERTGVWASIFTTYWNEPTQVSSDAATSLSAGMDDAGNGFLVWTPGREDGRVMAARYDSSAARWSDPVDLSSGYVDSGKRPPTAAQVAVSANGNAFAVWHAYFGMAMRLYAARFTPETGWGNAVAINTQLGLLKTSSLAVDATGNALAVWDQNTPSASLDIIYVNHFD